MSYLTTEQAHEWKRARSHVEGLKMLANGLERGLTTTERAGEVLSEYADWLERDLEVLREQLDYLTAQAELSGLRRGKWEERISRAE